MKKILHIQVLPKLSGVQKISLEIFRALPDDQYQKWVLFSTECDAGDRNACIQAFEQVGAKVLLSKNLKRSIGLSDFAAAREIYKLCRKERFDIVHTHSTKPGIIGRIAATLARVPKVVHTVHGLAFHRYVRFPRWQFYWACEMFASLFCHRIIMVNKYYGRYFKWFGKKVTTIYNGIDFNQFPQIEKSENNFPKLLFVGRLDEQKDPITLLQALQRVTQIEPRLTCTLVGDGEKYAECKTFIEAHGLTENVTLSGWQNNVTHYYASHDIFVASSIYESFGLMFVEAGYYFLPSVATNVEGIPEIIQDNKTGFLCEPRNPDKIAENILRLVHEMGLRKKMGQAAHAYVTEQFTAQKMTEQYKAIYENAPHR